MKQFFTWRSAFMQSDLPSNTKLILFCISTYMNDHGEGAYPAQETLETVSSLSLRSVKTHIKIAIEKGWITKRIHGYSGRGWRRYEYQISFPGFDEEDISRGGGEESPFEIAGAGDAPPYGIGSAGDAPPQEQRGANSADGGANDDTNVVQQLHTITPEISPVNSPVINEGENQEFKNQSKKRKRYGSAKCTIDKILDPDGPCPDEYRKFAEECGVAGIDRLFEDWAGWWSSEAGKKAGERGWFQTWKSRVRRHVDRQNANNRDRSSKRSGDDALSEEGRNTLIRRRNRQMAGEPVGQEP